MPTPTKQFKVRRITPNGSTEIRARKDRSEPPRERIYERRDPDGSGLRVQVQKFNDGVPEQLVRGEGGQLEWSFRSRHLPPPDEPMLAVTIKDIPTLAKRLHEAGFSPAKKVWLPELSLILEALAPIIQSLLAEYSGFRLKAETQRTIWDRLANVVWDGLSDETACQSEDFWRTKISAALRDLLRHDEPHSYNTDETPKTPGAWYAHRAEWVGRLRKACSAYPLSFAHRTMVENACSCLFVWLNFAIRRPSCQGQSAPMTLREFENEVFFPAVEAALTRSFGNPPARAVKSPFRARPDYVFQKDLFHEARGRFNRLRTHWRGTKRYPGRTAPNPLETDEYLLEAAEIVTSGLGSMRAKETRSIKTLMLLIEIEKSLPKDLGRRELRSTAYKRLAKKTGVAAGTLRKRVHDAKRLLYKYLQRGRRNAQKGNDLALVCERPNSARECKRIRTMNTRRGSRHEPPRRSLSSREIAADRSNPGKGGHTRL